MLATRNTKQATGKEHSVCGEDAPFRVTTDITNHTGLIQSCLPRHRCPVCHEQRTRVQYASTVASSAVTAGVGTALAGSPTAGSGSASSSSTMPPSSMDLGASACTSGVALKA